jgi:hypothetical protein
VGPKVTPLLDRIGAPGPKRLLALDGGGVRGVLSLAIVERIEAILRERSSAPDRFHLSDYFDLIGGTSTGAIIASGLALGLSASELLDHYRALASRAFRAAPWKLGLFASRFSDRPLAGFLNEIIGDVTLGSNRIQTGLAIVTKRADNGSVWILHNNPRGRYFAPSGDDDAASNAEIPLSAAILASTAAPTFFHHRLIRVGRTRLGAFIDGGVSPHNNPSLALMMLANLKGYGFNWPLGADRLMLVSVGTGFFRLQHSINLMAYTPSGLQAINALASVIDDGSRLVQTIMQWASQSATPHQIDSEVGDLAGDQLGPAPLIRYLRYDGQLEIDWLQNELGISVTPRQIAIIRQMSNPAAISLMIEIGREIARRHVRPEHFPGAFDATG